MRFPIPALALFVCASAFFALPARAPSDLIRTESDDATLSPYFWVKSEDPTVDRLPLKSTSVKTSIAGVIADVRVTQVYKNEGRKPLEAVYVFPGSTRAAVHGMKMTLGDRTIQAQIRGKEQARQEYEQAKQQGKSASLLEQQRPNVFQMNVANIMPGDEIKVELSYTELLVPTDGTYEFVYPTVVGPRYANASNSEKWVASPYTKQGEAPLSILDIAVRLSAGLPIQRMACETHKTSISYDGPSDATLKLDTSESRGGNRDFILKYQLAGGQIHSGLLLSKGQDENFFLLMVQPPKQVQSTTIPPREFVFIMDVSGSMDGYPIETSKALMKDLVGHLRPQDRFNLLVFASGSGVWSASGSKPATPENLRSALSYVGDQSGGGGTEIVPALQRALALPRTEGMSRTVVIATDGYVSVEPKVLDVVRDNLGNANMFAFGIGTAVNRHLIEGIAHAGMGEPFIITKSENAAAQAEKFRQYIASPVLTQIKASFKGFDAYDVEPLHLPDVLSERPVICFGKWRGEPKGTLEISGLSGSGSFHQRFNVSEAQPKDSNGALRFLWARHRIQLLGDYGGLGDIESQKKAITDLGLKYGLLTNYTSFVAIDTQVRNQGGHMQQVNQPLPLPEGVSNLAVGGSPMPASVPITYEAKVECEAAPSFRRGLKLKASAHDSGGFSVPAQVSKPQKAPVIQPGTLTTNPSGQVTTALVQDLGAKLKDPALVRLLSSRPEGTALEVRVNAAGRVIGASFSQPFPGASSALKLIRAWRFVDWKGRGTTLLSISL